MGNWDMPKGKPEHPLRNVWRAMIRRCFDTECPEWHWYGSRGIGVCDRWMKFENFIADMGERPPRHSIDRINNDGWYEPGNCRWATMKEQTRNFRRNRMIEYDGRRMCLADWTADRGLGRGTIHSRLLSGWTVGQALGFEPEPSSRQQSLPRMIRHNDRCLSMSEWVAETGINATTIAARLDMYGWTVGQALGIDPRHVVVRGGRFEHAGRTMTVRDWAAETGIHQSTISGRIFKHGWTVGQALGFEPR
jgi:hypothetical protein